MFPPGGCDPGLGHDQPISESDIQQIAAQAALKEFTEKQRRTIEKSLQSKVHGSGDASINVDALPKTKGARRAVKGRTCGPSP